jgi:acyl dehydratase
MGEAIAMTFESLHDLVGKEVAVTDWIAITQDRIDRFAEATEDRQWIHLDRDRAARESPYGSTIAHGFLTLSLLSHFSRDLLPVEGVNLRVNYGFNRVRFPAPVRVESKIRARFTLQAVKGEDVTLAVVMEVEGSQKPCCVAEWIVRYSRNAT